MSNLMCDKAGHGRIDWTTECPADECDACKLEAKAAEIERLKANRADYADRQVALSKQANEIERLKGLLKAAKCPSDCDGGVIVKAAYQHDNGEIEYDLEQCQWCAEVAALDTVGEKGQQESK